MSAARADDPATADPSAPLRILHVVTQREPAGAQRMADQLCRSMRAAGHRSDVWFLYRREPAFVEEDYIDLLADRPGPFGTIRLVGRLVGALRDWQPDMVVAHTHHANAIASIAGRLAGVPRRVVVHHTLGQYESRARRSTMGLLRRARVFHDEVYVSETTRASYGRRAGHRGVVINNGVEMPTIHGAWRADPRRDPSRPLVVSIGRLTRQKDHATLIDAMQTVAEADLAIVGEGDLRDDLAGQVTRLGLHERVALVGNIEPEEVGDALAAADLVVLPSIWEAFGMLVLEAMAAGKPMVVSDIPAHREALGDAAMYHPPGDTGALAYAIRTVLQDDELRAALAAEAFRRSTRFTLESAVSRYLALARR